MTIQEQRREAKDKLKQLPPRGFWIKDIDDRQKQDRAGNEIYYTFVSKLQNKQYHIYKTSTDKIKARIAKRIMTINYEGWYSGSITTHIQYLYAELILIHNDNPIYKNDLSKWISIVYKLGSKYRANLIVPITSWSN